MTKLDKFDNWVKGTIQVILAIMVIPFVLIIGLILERYFNEGEKTDPFDPKNRK